MIEMPRRSVTRFFIPLIDVLTLLFCIFLVMPLAKDADAAAVARREQEHVQGLEAEIAKLKREGFDLPEKLKKERAELKEERERFRERWVDVLQRRMEVRVLEIDPDRGILFYHGPRRADLPTREDVRKLIEGDREGEGPREMVYLVLFPRDGRLGAFDLGRRGEYEEWFKGAVLKFETRTAARRGPP
jgi:hypothetical protein